MEPPIRDASRDRDDKGHLFLPLANTLVYFFISEIGTTSLQGTKSLAS